MNLNTKSISKKYFFYFFIFLIATLGFEYSEQNKTSEFMTINVQYEGASQFIYIMENSKELVKIAVVPEKMSGIAKRNLHEKGYKILKDEAKNEFDNIVVFDLINKYEKIGWKLQSHSMAFNDFEGIFNTESSPSLQYLLSK